ncbi:hypothetical protein CFOL_v3_07831 [Cephalotus follicularis]|uniref:Uncharacterized protein n=1 Tax=Cephalotus follicularis TaxID=3775 RepID=A0A1Q3B958_CEPFO|nr:hypothetical protein CFOL_v3_07831 [Cephalotus follicularis]
MQKLNISIEKGETFTRSTNNSKFQSRPLHDEGNTVLENIEPNCNYPLKILPLINRKLSSLVPHHHLSFHSNNHCIPVNLRKRGYKLQFKIPQQMAPYSLYLQVCKGLTKAPMPATTKGNI